MPNNLNKLISLNSKKCIFASLLLVIFLTYWQSLYLPFISDDYGLLHIFQTNDNTTIIKSIFSYKNTLFYRPLGQLYFLGLYNIFGDDAFYYHVAALFIHTLNSFLVFIIFREIMHSKNIAYAVSTLYAASYKIHIYPLAWIVGIYDIGGTLFFFGSIYFYLKQRISISVTCYLIGCLFKEAVIFMPFVIMAHNLLLSSNAHRHEKLTGLVKLTLPFMIILLTIISIKLYGISSLDSVSPTSYRVEFWGAHYSLLSV